MRCGLITLRRWVSLRSVFDMITILLPVLLPASKDIFTSCTEDPSGVLNEPVQHYEVEQVCSQLKHGVTGVSIDYEHIRLQGQIFGFYYISCFKTSLINSQFVMI